MYIIHREPNENGSRPPLQSWAKSTPPDGYALCPDEFAETFYSTTPAGFVTITVDGDTVTAMEVNREALETYQSMMPEPQEPTPTAEEQMRADIDYIAAMTGVDLT